MNAARRTTEAHPPKWLVVYQGKGTAHEKRINTGIKLYWVDALERYCSIPDDIEEPRP